MAVGVGGVVVACPELHTQSCPSQDFPGNARVGGPKATL